MISRRMKMSLTIAGVVASFSAGVVAWAGSSISSTPTHASDTSRALPFEVLHNGINSGYTRLSEFVIRDGDEFTRRWRGVLQGAPDAVKPEINFEKTTVVLVAIGSRNTGGYSVRVDSLVAASTGATVHYATVHYTVTSPGSRCMSLQELTSPVEVIIFDHLEGEIKFKKKSVSGAC